MNDHLTDTNVGNIEYIRKADAAKALGEEYIPRTDFERGMVSQLSCDKAKIKALPSADVAPVVRCKDCKGCEYDTAIDQYWCTRGKMIIGRRVMPDDFCSYGERKE